MHKTRRTIGTIDIVTLVIIIFPGCDNSSVKLNEQSHWLIGAICLSLIVLSLVSTFFVRNRNEGKRLEKLVQERTTELEKQLALMSVVNSAALLLLESGAENYLDSLKRSMEVICRHLGVDCLYLWQNNRKEDGKLYYRQVCKWVNKDLELDENLLEFSYQDTLPKWEKFFLKGQSINGPLDWLPDGDNLFLKAYRIHSLLAIPLFLKEELWGFVSCDDCQVRRIFPEAQEHALQSWGLLAMGVIQRGEIAQDMRSALVKSMELQRELETAMEAAETASRSKSAFLANMSHEMRTPMNVVVGLTDLMLEEDDPTVNMRDNLNKVSKAGNTLLGLINDVLDISKIEAGRLELMPVQYELPSLLSDVIALNIIRIEERPITFILDVDGDLPFSLYGDDLRVKQIINNLLSNAFKYTQKGTVTLGVKCLPDLSPDQSGTVGQNVWMTMYIMDTGIGIRKEDMDKLFTDYNQVDIRTHRRIEGTGLGLSITKMLVEHMSGEISVESEYGKGSLFRFRIRQGFPSEQVIGEEIAENLRSFRYAEDKRIASKKLVRPNLSYARVLVVDDMQTNLDVAAGLLGKYKMLVDCVTSGQEAIDLIRNSETVYDAIFMDHMMPGMDGVEAAEGIRKIGSKYAVTIPIIALTANAIAGNEQMFLSGDFQAFLPKPINIMNLDSVVQKWVRDKARE